MLLQVVFHARIAEEHPDEPFSVDDVAGGIVAKLVHRHPHVFGEETARTPEEVKAHWMRTKAEEKRRESVTDGVPVGQPALALATKLAARARGAGLAVPLPSGRASVTSCWRWRRGRRRRGWTRRPRFGLPPGSTGTRSAPRKQPRAPDLPLGGSAPNPRRAVPRAPKGRGELRDQPAAHPHGPAARKPRPVRVTPCPTSHPRPGPVHLGVRRRPLPRLRLAPRTRPRAQDKAPQRGGRLAGHPIRRRPADPRRHPPVQEPRAPRRARPRQGQNGHPRRAAGRPDDAPAEHRPAGPHPPAPPGQQGVHPRRVAEFAPGSKSSPTVSSTGSPPAAATPPTSSTTSPSPSPSTPSATCSASPARTRTTSGTGRA